MNKKEWWENLLIGFGLLIAFGVATFLWILILTGLDQTGVCDLDIGKKGLEFSCNK